MKAQTLLGASVLALALTAGQAAAQDQVTVQEVIVTATKKAQTLQEVPISLAAVSGEVIEERGIRQFTDLQASVPNLQIDQTNGNYAITIRGLGSGASNLAFEQSVGLFVDGVYSGRARSLQTAFMDVERVEVVRGPQGALFGKNTNAGAISLISRAPTRSFEAEARVGAEFEYGGWTASGFISGPLGDNLAGRFTVSTGYSGPYIENRLTKQDEYDNQYYGIRGQLRWEPTDDLDVTFKIEGSQNEISGGNIVFNNLGTCGICNLARNAAGGPGVAQEKPDFWRTSSSERPEYNDTSTALASVVANWDLGDWTLTSITAYSGVVADQAIDTDVSALHLLDAHQAERSNQFFQEFRISGTIGENLDVIGGLTYLKSKLKIVQLVYYNGAPYGLPMYQADADRSMQQKSESISPYIALDYRLTDHWHLSGSLRYSNETKDAHISQVYTGVLPATNMPYDLNGSMEEGLWDYSAKVRYQFNRDAQVYLSYATGTKGGGFISNDGLLLYNILFNNGSMDYDSERAKSWELGAKFRLFDGRGDLNIAIFDTDFTDLQVSSFTGTGFTTGNAAKAKSQGVEVETNWRPNEIFSFGGSVAYLDAKYDDYPGAACVYNAPVGCTPATNNLKGYALTRAPEWKWSAYAQVEVPVTDDLEFTGRVSADYTDLSYYQSDMNPLNAQPAYTKVDARLAIKSISGRWEAALIGRNLTDEVVFSQAFNVPLIGGNSHGAMINPPRTIAMELVKKF